MSALILLVFFTHRVGVRKTGSANGVNFAKQPTASKLRWLRRSAPHSWGCFTNSDFKRFEPLQAPLMGLISQTGGNPPFGDVHGVGVRKYGIAPYSKRAAGTGLKILPSGMGYLVKLVSLKHWHWPTPPPTQKKNPPHGRVWLRVLQLLRHDGKRAPILSFPDSRAGRQVSRLGFGASVGRHGLKGFLEHAQRHAGIVDYAPRVKRAIHVLVHQGESHSVFPCRDAA